jgi:glutaredoxin 3
MSAEVEIYTTMYCPFCWRAKDLLSSKSVDYVEIDVGAEPDRRREMTDRSHGGRTVPQIFINGTPVGGSDELHALDRQGKLDPMLTGAA